MARQNSRNVGDHAMGAGHPGNMKKRPGLDQHFGPPPCPCARLTAPAPPVNVCRCACITFCFLGLGLLGGQLARRRLLGAERGPSWPAALVPSADFTAAPLAAVPQNLGALQLDMVRFSLADVRVCIRARR